MTLYNCPAIITIYRFKFAKMMYSSCSSLLRNDLYNTFWEIRTPNWSNKKDPKVVFSTFRLISVDSLVNMHILIVAF